MHLFMTYNHNASWEDSQIHQVAYPDLTINLCGNHFERLTLKTQIQRISSGASLPENNINLEKILKSISLFENNQLIKMWIEGWMCDFPHHEVTMDWMPTRSHKNNCKIKCLWGFCKIINTCPETSEISYWGVYRKKKNPNDQYQKSLYIYWKFMTL